MHTLANRCTLQHAHIQIMGTRCFDHCSLSSFITKTKCFERYFMPFYPLPLIFPQKNSIFTCFYKCLIIRHNDHNQTNKCKYILTQKQCFYALKALLATTQSYGFALRKHSFSPLKAMLYSKKYAYIQVNRQEIDFQKASYSTAKAILLLLIVNFSACTFYFSATIIQPFRTLNT